MTFNVASHRKNLGEILIPYARENQFSEAFELKTLASHGQSILLISLDCFLSGLFDVGNELLPKARTFLQAAIKNKEISPDYFRGGDESERLIDFAMCNWLIDKRQDLASLKEAVKWREIWFAEIGESDKTNVQLTLPEYLDAEEYDTLFRRFEAAGLTKPKNLRSIKGEGTMSYVLARHRLGLEFSADEVRAALDTFFKRNMRANWLDRGQYPSVAQWMKLAFWKPGDDPIATLLRCYDYLPDLERPQHPQAADNPTTRATTRQR